MGDYDHLGKFLDDYMDEDFRARYETHKGAGRAFRLEASAEDVAAVLAELEAFLAWAETVPTRTWQGELMALGGRWKPRSVGPLRGLVGALRGEKRWLEPGERPIRPRHR